MIYKDRILDILRLSSKMNLNEEEKSAFLDLIMEYDKEREDILFDELRIHKIEFLFLKHIIEANSIYGIFDKRRMIEISERLAFLQIKYKEYIDEATRISEALMSINVKFAWLKGASIIDLLYKSRDIVYRDFGDFDILVSNSELSKANIAFESCGFIQGKVDHNMHIVKADRREILQWLLNSHQEMKFIKKSSFFDISPRLLINLDANTTIFEGGKKIDPISTDYLLNNTTISTRYGCNCFYSLIPTIEFIQLCYHFYKDTQYESKKNNKQNYNLIKFCDIKEYYQCFNQLIDKNVFIGLIKKSNIKREIFSVLWMVSSFYNDEMLKQFALQIIEKQNHYENYDWDKILLHYR